MKLSALLALLTGCTPKPPPKAGVADLHFPVAVLFPSASIVLFKDKVDLGVMHMNYVLDSGGASPVVIDSNFDIYTMERLRSTHGGLWLMAHPSGTTEVAFDLTRSPKSGLEAARKAMRAQLDKQTWRHEIEEKRKSLAAQKTLVEMVDLLHDQNE